MNGLVVTVGFLTFNDNVPDFIAGRQVRECIPKSVDFC